MTDFEVLENNDFLELLNYITNYDCAVNNYHFTNKKKSKSIKCQSDNCEKNARYGLIRFKPIFCRLHKTTIQHDVLSKKCKDPNCTIQPSFGYINTSTQYCKKHSLPDMINVKSKLCCILNCTKRANYGYENQKVTHCTMHHLSGMIKKKSKLYKKNKI